MQPESEEVPRGEYPDLDEQEDLAAQQEGLLEGEEGAEPGEEPEAGDTGEEGPDASADNLDLLDPDAQPEASAAAAAGQPPASPEGPPQPFEPPPGEPFAFRVDGRDVEVEGAVRYPNGVYFPADTWERLHRDFVADRPALYRSGAEYGYKAGLAQVEQHPKLLEAAAITKEFLEVMSKTPQEIAEWLDNYNANKALLFERIRSQAAEARLKQMETQGAAQTNEAAVQSLVREIPVYVDRAVETVLQEESLKLLGPEKAALVKWIMSPGVLQSVLFEADRDYPEANLRQGQVIVRHDVLRRLLGPIADKARAGAKKQQRQGAERRNRAALGQGRRAPLAVPGRGAAAPGARQPKPVSRESWRDEVLGVTPDSEE